MEKQTEQGDSSAEHNRTVPLCSKYYSWDNLHNEIEVFDRLGKHIGAIDPTTGEFIKQAVKGRSIKL